MFDPALHRQANRLYSVVVGIVIDNKDPEGRYRVKVKYPWVLESSDKYTDLPDEGDFVSNWARITTLFAGSKEGAEFRFEEAVGGVEVERGRVRAVVTGMVRRPVSPSILSAFQPRPAPEGAEPRYPVWFAAASAALIVNHRLPLSPTGK